MHSCGVLANAAPAFAIGRALFAYIRPNGQHRNTQYPASVPTTGLIRILSRNRARRGQILTGPCERRILRASRAGRAAAPEARGRMKTFAEEHSQHNGIARPSWGSFPRGREA